MKRTLLALLPLLTACAGISVGPRIVPSVVPIAGDTAALTAEMTRGDTLTEFTHWSTRDTSVAEVSLSGKIVFRREGIVDVCAVRYYTYVYAKDGVTRHPIRFGPDTTHCETIRVAARRAPHP